LNDNKPKTVFDERDQLRRENEALRATTVKANDQIGQLINQLDAANAEAEKWKTGADNMARLYEQAKRDLEAARKAVNAVIQYLDLNGDDAEADAEAWHVLGVAVDEYRKFTEPPPLESRIDAALSDLDAKAAAVEGVYREGGDVEC